MSEVVLKIAILYVSHKWLMWSKMIWYCVFLLHRSASTVILSENDEGVSFITETETHSSFRFHFPPSYWSLNYFVHPETWGRWTHFDKHIFQMGWNMGWIHQLVVNVHILSRNVFFCCDRFFSLESPKKKHSGLADSTCQAWDKKRMWIKAVEETWRNTLLKVM